MYETRTRPTVMDRLRTHASRRSRGQSGLGLLDVLLGMAIFSMIAVIGVQSMDKMRGRGYVNGASSDAQQLALSIESYLTDNSVVPSAVTLGVKQAVAPTGAVAVTTGDLNVNLSNGNAVRRYAATGSGYIFCIVRKTATVNTAVDGWAFYSSDTDAVTKSGTGAPAAYNATTSPCGP